jgi:hypothetical protein
MPCFLAKRAGVHRAQIAVQVNRDDGLGARRDRRFDQRRVETPGVRQDVHEHRLRTQVHDGRAVAIQLVSAMMTSSPGPMPSAAMPMCSAPVQLEVAMAWFDAQMPPEEILETVDVGVAVLAPAVGRRVGGVADFELGDRRLGIQNAGLHRNLNSGTAEKN